jgi:hypothetical protein
MHTNEQSIYDTINAVKANPVRSFEYWILLGSVLTITEEKAS